MLILRRCFERLLNYYEKVLSKCGSTRRSSETVTRESGKARTFKPNVYDKRQSESDIAIFIEIEKKESKGKNRKEYYSMIV